MNSIVRKIYRDILKRIAAEEIKGGEKLPPEIMLAKMFHTNRMNAREAVKELESNGLVVRKKRIGTSLRESIDLNAVSGLIKEVNRIVYVLYSATPHWIHWNNSSFQALENEVAAAGYSVIYEHIPTVSTRENHIQLLNKITEIGASALVIFPDMEDWEFLKDNGDLLLDFQMPVYMLNRSGEPMALDMVSFISMDPFGDGIIMGTLLRRSQCRNIVMINDATGQCFWGHKRYEGLLVGLSRGNGVVVSPPENILSDSEGFTKVRDQIIQCKGDMVVVGANNHFAAQFIDYAKKQGLSTPADYQMIAFDDNPLFRSYNLTSLAVPMESVGRLFGKLICDRSWLEDYRGKVSIRVNSELVVRETFKPLT